MLQNSSSRRSSRSRVSSTKVPDMLQMNNNNLYRFDMKHFPERPPINLAFDNVTYTVDMWHKLQRNKKTILHGVSGEFRSGEVTAIMGPSGAGKSTLLNILAGYRVSGSGGKIYINGEDRKEIGLDEFKKFSCYIQQDDEHRIFLTVREAMMFAAHLKLGRKIPYSEKAYKNGELLQMLGLGEHSETACGRLSGGQQKRLSIALELITNPPVIFLDEPTTGLDSSSSSSCISLIKSLASQGRTMVCTIHQPSALIFEQFTQLYCITHGRCIYQGPPTQVSNFLSQYSFNCPTYHNPADYIIEVAIGEHGTNISPLVEASEKQGQESIINALSKVPENQRGLRMYDADFDDVNLKKKIGSATSVTKTWRPENVPWWYQYFHLFNRNLLSLRRNVFYMVIRLLAHFVVSLVFGYLYYDSGRTADTLFANGIYIYGSNLFLNYTALMTVLLSFPLEYKLLTREHFNRWYSLVPYCFALILIEIPFQMLCAMVYIIPSYILTSQPLEWFRFGLFVLFNMAITFTALGMGFLSGAVFPITIAVFLAPTVTVFFSVFGFTSSRLEDVPPYFRFAYSGSYFRAAFQGSVISIYGLDRDVLQCDGFYCHYRHPTKFFPELGFSYFEFQRDFMVIGLFSGLLFAGSFVTVLIKLMRR